MSDVESIGNARYRVQADGRSTLAYAVVNGPEAWVFLDGQVFVVDDDTNGGREAHLDAEVALSAPMPATVIAITVAAGQRVKSGDPLLLLEAMKMELPIVAPRDGEVREVRCAVGELVQPGIPLVEFV